MTRVFDSGLAAGQPGLRALVIGAGAYPFATGNDARVPKLAGLTSVGPSVRAFVTQLIKDWRTELAVPLASVDLLLSEPQAPEGSQWQALGVPGEIADRSPIDSPTLTNVQIARTRALDAATPADHFLFLCCGHGFWKVQRYFVLSDFGQDPYDPWQRVIALDMLALGLRTTPPRTQWQFFDCCADISSEVLDTLGAVGTPLIRATASQLSKATSIYGRVDTFGLAAAAPAEAAFGNQNAPSRFCEALLEALGGAGAIATHQGEWWVDHTGIIEAIKSYPRRTPNQQNGSPDVGAVPISNDSPARMLFRRAPAPKSCLVARSVPRHLMRHATLQVTPANSDAVYLAAAPVGQAKVHISLPPRTYWDVTITDTQNKALRKQVYSSLPLAEPDELVFQL